MDTRMVVRLTEVEKEDLTRISSELELTLSDYVRKRLLGKSLKKEYLYLIKNRIDKYEEGKIFTLKEVLGMHWEYISKLERRTLLEEFIEAIEDEELNVDVDKITKKGKYKFVKIDDLGKIGRLFREYLNKYSEDE